MIMDVYVQREMTWTKGTSSRGSTNSNCCCNSGAASVWIKDCYVGRYVIQRHLKQVRVPGVCRTKSWNWCITMQDNLEWRKPWAWLVLLDWDDTRIGEVVY